MADIAEARAGFDLGDAVIEAFLRDLDQALGVRLRRADMEHLAGVAVVAVLDDGDVDVDDVAVLQDFLVRRNAVADHFVDRGADRLGKAVVVQRRRDCLLHVDHVVVADAVELAGGDAGLDIGRNHFEHVGGEAAGDAHFFEFFGGVYGHESMEQSSSVELR